MLAGWSMLGAEDAGGGAVCCNLTFQTLMQPVRMAHPWNLLHPSRLGSAIFRMQVAECCDVDPNIITTF